MLSFLPIPIKGLLAIILTIINTLFWSVFLLTFAVIKLIIPMNYVRKVLSTWIIRIATFWVSCNDLIFKLLQRIDWEMLGNPDISMNEWYLISCNHQSWADIPVMQSCLNGKAPFLKFFLKKELIWVPVLGLCWWGLDFPFMKRYSREYLEKHPEMQGKDMETTKKACEKFKYTPISIFNFMEGTRFKPEKHKRQQSPYRNLLKPKAGGAAFVLESMGEYLSTMLDVTIVYPEGKHGFWELVSGQIPKIIIHIEKVDIPKDFLGKSYTEDNEFKRDFQKWVSERWEKKDLLISELKKTNVITFRRYKKTLNSKELRALLDFKLNSSECQNDVVQLV
jgi:1-acyl-sn-glycerol-3-phosphate acyltransferase